MTTLLKFVLFTLLLTGGAFFAMAVPHLTMQGTWLRVLAAFFLGGALALLVKYCGRGAMLVAIPLAVLSANYLSLHIWPLEQGQPLFRAYHRVARYNAAYRRLRAQLSPLVRTRLEVAPILRRSWGHSNRYLMAVNGLRISLYAAGLVRPRNMVFTGDGTLLVTQPQLGQILRLRDSDGDGVADEVSRFATALEYPSGIARYGDDVLVASAGAVLVLDASGAVKRLLADDLPWDDHCWAHSLVVDKEGNVFVAVAGCTGLSDWRRGTVIKIDSSGRQSLYSSGLYDCTALAIHPVSASIWAGEDSPDTIKIGVYPDEINVLRAGGDYGWPFCYAERKPDKRLGAAAICAETKAPLVQLPAHSSPAGLAFGAGLNAAPWYRNMVYVVLRGSSYDHGEQGFRLLGLPLVDGERISGWGVDLISGWNEAGLAWGQPEDCVVGSDGCLYISDSLAGCIYRVQFAGQ